jgi:hypothetical protein
VSERETSIPLSDITHQYNTRIGGFPDRGPGTISWGLDNSRRLSSNRRAFLSLQFPTHSQITKLSQIAAGIILMRLHYYGFNVRGWIRVSEPGLSLSML